MICLICEEHYTTSNPSTDEFVCFECQDKYLIDGYGNIYQPEMLIDFDGTKRWWVNNKCHRLDGPAIEYIDGTKHWYVRGQLHREDGPAVEDSDGTKHWFINDIPYPYEEWKKKVRKNEF